MLTKVNKAQRVKDSLTQQFGKEIAGKACNKIEEMIHPARKQVECVEESTGKVKRYSPEVFEVKQSKGQVSRQRKVFSVPELPWKKEVK